MNTRSAIWLLVALLLLGPQCTNREDNPLWPDEDDDDAPSPHTSTQSDSTGPTADVNESEPALADVVEADVTPELSGQPIPTTPNGQVFSFADLVERVVPAVVNISTTRLVLPRRPDDLYLPLKEQEEYGLPAHRILESLGSGFIIDKDGFILTSLHVVAEADTIRVRLHDGREFEGKVVGRDSKTDIALLKVNGVENLEPVTLGDSSKLRVGDWVIAIGNPFGLSSTVTAGIVSAVGRRDVDLEQPIDYSNFIQTDASINPGNSGGPLIDVNGNVVGISTAINRRGQGIGFAIPINMAKIILKELKREGRVSRAFLGVYVDHVSQELAVKLGWDTPHGAVIDRIVKGGPADLAGLEQGDIILSFNEKEIKKADELPWLVATAGVGQVVKVVIIRGMKQREYEVIMGIQPKAEDVED